MVIVPEDDQFPGWDFIHYAVERTPEKTTRRVTFGQITVSEGETLMSGVWKVDSDHTMKMKKATGILRMAVLQLLFTDAAE